MPFWRGAGNDATFPRAGILPMHSFDGSLLEVQLALRLRNDGISRTFSSTGLRTGAARPYGSRRCGGAGRASVWRAAGINDGGLAYCGDTLRSIRSVVRRLSLLSRPARSVSEPSAGCAWRAEERLSIPVATTETRTIPSRFASKVAPT